MLIARRCSQYRVAVECLDRFPLFLTVARLCVMIS